MEGKKDVLKWFGQCCYSQKDVLKPWAVWSVFTKRCPEAWSGLVSVAIHKKMSWSLEWFGQYSQKDVLKPGAVWSVLLFIADTSETSGSPLEAAVNLASHPVNTPLVTLLTLLTQMTPLAFLIVLVLCPCLCVNNDNRLSHYLCVNSGGRLVSLPVC